MVNAGYKQTEVGIIPEDWDVMPLHKLTKQIIDGTHHTPTYTSDGVPFLRVTDVQSSEINLEILKYISLEEHQILTQRCKPEAGDLLLSKNGTIGITKVVDWDWEFSVFVSLALIKVIQERLNVNYLCQFFNSDYLSQQIRGRSKQGAVTNLHLEEIREFLIPTPPFIEEQTAIATVLSDVDALIASLNAQIAKKRDIKTATMQQLLTGKQRLAGFGAGKGMKPSELGEIPEDWEVIPLSGMVDIRDGTHASPKYKTEGIPLVTSKNLVGRIIDLSDASLISTEDADEINKRSKVHKGDILMSMIGTIGSAILVKDEPDFCIKNIALFKPKRINGQYLFCLMQSPFFQSYIADRLDGGIQKFISLGVLRTLLIIHPPIDEQAAIAGGLSAMDEDIAALEQRLAKTKAMKQGMMQELLTGRTRLV